MKDKDAIHDVRRKVDETINKHKQKKIFGFRGAPEPTRSEGEVWEAIDGRKWTVKNGIKQNITKLDDAKTPWWCPKCQKPLNHKLDMKFLRIRNQCFDCTTVQETEMRRTGKWEEFEKKTMLRNYIAMIKDKIAELQNYHDTVSQPEFINADDTRILMVERWNIDIPKLKADLMVDIKKLQEQLDETIAEHGTGE